MTDVPEAVGRRILRLLAVEHGLQDEGQGNAARLSVLQRSARRCGPRAFTRD
jgi:hypothetical protein